MRFLKTLPLAFLLFPFLSYGQSDRTTIEVDLNLTFTLPSEYTKIDTLGQDIYQARTAFGSVQVARIPQPAAQIRSKEELISFYKEFQRITVHDRQGDVVSDSTIEFNDLNARFFEFENSWDDTVQVQEYTIVFIDKTMYSFTYAYFRENEQLAEDDKKVFLSGITFRDPDFRDQLTLERNKNVEAGEFFGYIMRYVIIAIVLVAVVLFFLKKFQLVRWIINMVSLGFLTWGAVCIFLYLINLFWDNKVVSLLVGGVVCLIIGFVLRKIKLPITK